MSREEVLCMIKHIVLDIGNVLVTFEPVKHFSAYFKDEEKTKRLCSQVFGHDAWEKYDQGIYFMEDLKRIYQDAYPQDYEDISYILQHWLSLMKFKPETFTYAKQLQERGFEIYLLSNISEDSANYLKQTMPFFDAFEKGVLSYAVNINKPDKRIYEHLLHTYQLRPDETIFLDDSKLNVEQAQALGIHAFVFDTIENAIEDVERTIRSYEEC